MNPNYIAPEALDDQVKPTCKQCGTTFLLPEAKIKFFQGVCPKCGLNPTAIAIQREGAPSLGNFFRSSYQPVYYEAKSVVSYNSDQPATSKKQETVKKKAVVKEVGHDVIKSRWIKYEGDA